MTEEVAEEEGGAGGGEEVEEGGHVLLADQWESVIFLTRKCFRDRSVNTLGLSRLFCKC